MPKVSNVSTGKPLVSGAVFCAPKGTTLPTSASAALDAAFKELGYVSEEGIINMNSPETENVKAWGGDIVLVSQTEKNDAYKLTLIEALNVDALKTVYNAENVTVATDGEITVKANAQQPVEQSYVIDMKLRDGALKRTVIPNGILSELGDITYNDTDPIGYETTISCLPDAAGNTHYEYIKPAPAA